MINSSNLLFYSYFSQIFPNLLVLLISNGLHEFDVNVFAKFFIDFPDFASC